MVTQIAVVQLRGSQNKTKPPELKKGLEGKKTGRREEKEDVLNVIRRYHTWQEIIRAIFRQNINVFFHIFVGLEIHVGRTSISCGSVLVNPHLVKGKRRKESLSLCGKLQEMGEQEWLE